MKEDMDIIQALGEERAEILRLHFDPLFAGDEESKGKTALQSVKNYHDLMQLNALLMQIQTTFPCISQHGKTTYLSLSFISLKLSERMSFLSTVDLLLYKIAAIVSHEDYWKSKNKGKLSAGIQKIKNVCRKVYGDESRAKCIEYLEEIQQITITCLDKKSEIMFLDFSFFPVVRMAELEMLYQGLSSLDWENPMAGWELDTLLEDIRMWETQRKVSKEELLLVESPSLIRIENMKH